MLSRRDNDDSRLSSSANIKYPVGDVCLNIKMNNPGASHHYTLYVTKNGKKVDVPGGSSLSFSEDGFNQLVDAIKNGTLYVINTLSSWGVTGSHNAKVLREALKKEKNALSIMSVFPQLDSSMSGSNPLTELQTSLL